MLPVTSRLSHKKNEVLGEGVGSTANIGATIKETLKAVRRLRGIVPKTGGNGGTPAPNP
jgi:hypothetical protein